MTLIDRIEAYLRQTPGVKAKDIALELDADRLEVNATLLRHRGSRFERSEGFTWSLAEAKPESGSSSDGMDQTSLAVTVHALTR